MKKLSEVTLPPHSQSPFDHLEGEIDLLRTHYGDETAVKAIIGAIHHIKKDPAYFKWFMDEDRSFPPAGNDSGPATLVWGSLARCLLAADKAWKESKEA